MHPSWQATFRKLSRPLTPEPTEVASRLGNLPGIRAVLFDIYGTLVISGSGDIGVAGKMGRAEAFDASLAACGIRADCGQQGVERLLATIERHHAQAREQGVAHPEVDLLRVWWETLSSLAAEGLLPAVDAGNLAAEYEARVNPVWPMPGAAECLASLRDGGRILGIISNAQAYTPAMLAALFSESLAALGFDRDVQYFSYQCREAKPSTRMYRMAREALGARGVAPEQVLYIGNDMLNDIWPASKVGFRTALFAGDARSLRMREDDSRVAALRPDLILEDLHHLCDCLD